jgi:hypothetical protein
VERFDVRSEHLHEVTEEDYENPIRLPGISATDLVRSSGTPSFVTRVCHGSQRNFGVSSLSLIILSHGS